jgi:hypothetical protein
MRFRRESILAEVFFADGDWQLVEFNHRAMMYIQGWSAIAHKCGWRGQVASEAGNVHVTRPFITYKQAHPLCIKCNDEVPPELVGLWKMHNWDQIQQLEATAPPTRPSFYIGPKPVVIVNGKKV